MTSILRRRDHSGPRVPYFETLQEALRQAGICQPTLVIDLERFDRNIDALKKRLPPGMGFRVVAKSLPAMDMLHRVMERTGSKRVMTFNLPTLVDLARERPEVDQLLGKPFPVSAARAFMAHTEASAHVERVSWLIDDHPRLRQYAELADAMGRALRIVLEIDVGLHRGGFESTSSLGEALRLLKAHPHLRFAGLMGYEAHVGKVPTLLDLQRRTFSRACARYREATRVVSDIEGEDIAETMLRNAGGSPTFTFYTDTEVANEVSVGSVLVKPSDFDLPHLDAFEPAAFIATPVLKVLERMRTPVLERLDRLKRWLNPNLSRAIFIHGGFWKALPVDPPGLSYNPTYGRSSNQELLNAGPKTAIDPDDFVFFRPTQSEVVLTGFGDIAVYSQGQISGWWPPFPSRA